MKTNESALDRVIRVVLGLVLLALFLTGIVGGTLGIILVVVGAILLITGIIGFCPLYALLKIKTKKA
jgi:Inner membrane protein YgaP-like, transmembrane domain